MYPVSPHLQRRQKKAHFGYVVLVQNAKHRTGAPRFQRVQGHQFSTRQEAEDFAKYYVNDVLNKSCAYRIEGRRADVTPHNYVENTSVPFERKPAPKQEAK